MTLRPLLSSVVCAGLLLAGCATKELGAGKEPELIKQPKSVVAQSGLNKSLLDAATAAERAKDYSAAATFYSGLVEQEPDNVDAVLGLSRNLRFLGASEPAIQILKRSLEQNKDDPRMVAELGKVQLAAGHIDDAVTTLIRARELTPGDWRVNSALGIAYDRLGRYDSAKVNYEHALSLAPDKVSIINNYALSLAQTGDLSGAIEMLKRASRLPGAGPQVRQNLALLYALNGDVEEAEKLARSDLPEKMVVSNLKYYKVLAENRRQAMARGEPVVPLKPLATQGSAGEGAASATTPAGTQITPWEDETDAERVGVDSQSGS